MRLKYYKRTLRQMRLNKRIVFFLIVVSIVIMSGVFIFKKAMPLVITLCESRAKSIALEVTNKAVSEKLKGITYENLITLKQDSNGKVIALSSNVMELNRLSTDISSDISSRLIGLDKKYVKIPLASMFGISFLSGYGPLINLSVVPSGYVTAKFNSQFEQAGINQIRHRIFITITTKVKLIAPFYTSSQEYVNEMTVAETIIVGDTPATYYNVKGVEGLDEKDTLNMLE